MTPAEERTTRTQVAAVVASAVAALVLGPARALAVAKLVGGAAHVASRVLSVVLWLLTLGEAKLSRSPLEDSVVLLCSLANYLYASNSAVDSPQAVTAGGWALLRLVCGDGAGPVLLALIAVALAPRMPRPAERRPPLVRPVMADKATMTERWRDRVRGRSRSLSPRRPVPPTLARMMSG